MNQMEHRAEVIADLNVRGMHTAVCSCGRMLGDSTREEAEREAREHRERPELPPLEPWHPGKHPIQD